MNEYKILNVKDIREIFKSKLLNNDKVVYSVFERIGGIRKMYDYLNKYNLI